MTTYDQWKTREPEEQHDPGLDDCRCRECKYERQCDEDSRAQEALRDAYDRGEIKED